MKKKKLTKPIIALALLFGALGWGGCNYFQEDPNPYAGDPCRGELYDEPKGNSYVELHPEIRDAVPYDKTMKTQTFMYCDSNRHCDTTTLFLEYDSLDWENGVGESSPCDTVFYEERSYLYKTKKNILSEGISAAQVGDYRINKLVVGVTFYGNDTIWGDFSALNFLSQKQVRNFNQNLIDTTINGKDFIGVKTLKDENGQIAGLYNLTEGILYIQNNRPGALIQYAYKIK